MRDIFEKLPTPRTLSAPEGRNILAPTPRIPMRTTYDSPMIGAPRERHILEPMEAPRSVVLVSADAAWNVIRSLHAEECERTPFGEAFVAALHIGEEDEPVVVMQGGWGKIAAAAATQYTIDRWRPELLLNIGTCGGFRGEIERGMVILVTRTIIYDIHVEIGDPRSEIDHYIVDIEPAPPRDSLPDGICTGTILTGDRDIIAADVPKLVEEYGALGADWESGAVAYVCKRNNTRCMIVRGVSDLVGPEGGEAYGDGNTLYEESTLHIIQNLDRQLPIWLSLA